MFQSPHALRSRRRSKLVMTPRPKSSTVKAGAYVTEVRTGLWTRLAVSGLSRLCKSGGGSSPFAARPKQAAKTQVRSPASSPSHHLSLSSFHFRPPDLDDAPSSKLANSMARPGAPYGAHPSHGLTLSSDQRFFFPSPQACRVAAISKRCLYSRPSPCLS